VPLAPPSSDAGRLTEAYRQAQATRAAQVAALVALYYRTRVDPANEKSVKAWLDQAVRLLMTEHRRQAQSGALYATALRRLELPGAAPKSFLPHTIATEEQIETSLRVVGPAAYMSTFRDIALDDEVDDLEKKAKLELAKKSIEVRITGAALRHAQNGGRQTTYAAATTDKVALGYIRVTRDKPCYFCALLASRGLQEGFTYTEDSFDLSDARFTGEGTAKVHDNCQCHLKPVYLDTDDYVDRSEFFENLYREFSTGGGAKAISSFRTGYNAWASGKVTVDF
jgi:hypothetical protein